MQKFLQNPLVRHSVEFSLSIIGYAEKLEANRKFVVARQLLRSATAIGANVMEAQTAESRADFIHKLKIADKEAHETLYWLYLCEQSAGHDFDESLPQKLNEIMKLINAIVSSAKKKT